MQWCFQPSLSRWKGVLATACTSGSVSPQEAKTWCRWDLSLPLTRGDAALLLMPRRFCSGIFSQDCKASAEPREREGCLEEMSRTQKWRRRLFLLPVWILTADEPVVVGVGSLSEAARGMSCWGTQHELHLARSSLRVQQLRRAQWSIQGEAWTWHRELPQLGCTCQPLFLPHPERVLSVLSGAEISVVSPTGAFCRGRAGARNGSWSEAPSLTFMSGSAHCPPAVPGYLLLTRVAVSCSKYAAVGGKAAEGRGKPCLWLLWIWQPKAAEMLQLKCHHKAPRSWWGIFWGVFVLSQS